jgi:hypothetical protein
MAIPTLASCAPATVFTAGQFVTLTGTNFRLAYPAPDVAGILPVPPPTVAVSFGGVAAERVCVFSATELTCIAPPHDPGAVAVTVQNLDVNGAPIAGEVVTLAAAATYARADLSIESDFTRITRALAKMLKQQIIDNVVITTDTDFSERAGETSFEVVDVGSLPCIVIGIPTTKINMFYDLDLTPEVVRGAVFDQRRYMRTVDITWKISGYDDKTIRASNLLALTQQVFSINDWLFVDIDPSDLSKGKVQYEMEAGDFGATGSASNSNVRSFAGEVTIKGFTFEDVAGFPGSMIGLTGGTITTDPSVTTRNI